LEPAKEGKAETTSCSGSRCRGNVPEFQKRRRRRLKNGLSKDAWVTPSSLHDDDDNDDDDNGDSVRVQDPDNRERIKEFSATHPSADENKMSMQP
jgi:hypothetical protein